MTLVVRDLENQLKDLLGFMPGNAPSWSQQESIQTKINTDPSIRGLVKEWLVTQGLPQKSGNAALAATLAKAYSSRAYLISWRNKVNPSFALLSGDDDILPQEETVAKPPAASPVPEDWLKALFLQINTTTEKLVNEKIAAAKLVLGEEAKGQIRSLAITAAQQRMEELAAPKKIEIHNVNRGTIVSLGLQHEKFPLLLRAVQAKDHKGFRLNVWLTGPTGSGKTSAAEAVSKALSLPFGSDGSLDADYKVLGFRDANGNIISTQFLDIYENGGIYVADEIDNWMPSALLSLNAALANGWVTSPKGLIKRHADTCVIACANTWGLGATNDYVGRTKLDAASLDRFHPKINWPIDEKLERAIAKSMAYADGEHWHGIVVETRRKVASQGLHVIISPRATFNGIALLEQGFSQDEVIEMTIAAGLSEEQKKAIGLIRAQITQQTIDDGYFNAVAARR